MNDAARPEEAHVDRTAELVAYLDGELDEAARQRVEQRLQTDPAARHELSQLGRAWEALDLLPLPAGDAASVHSTVAMVAVAAQNDIRRRIPWQPAARAIAVAGALCLAAGAGNLAVRWWRPDSNQALLDDLTLLEHLDALRQVPDAQAIRQLYAAKMFLPEAPLREATDSLAARRQRVTSLTESERDHLARQWERFQALPAPEQKRLREIDRQLRADPQSATLWQVLDRYHDWLKATLSTVQIEELRTLGAAERVARIREHLSEQELERGTRLEPHDLLAVARWAEQRLFVGGLVTADPLPPGRPRGPDEFARRRELWRNATQRARVGEGRWLARITDEDIAALGDTLSPLPAELLQRQSLAENRRLIAAWLRQVRRQKAIPVDDRALTEFFQQELSAEERDRLLRLPADEMQWQLRLSFLRAHRPPGPGGPPPHGQGPRTDRVPPREGLRRQPPPPLPPPPG